MVDRQQRHHGVCPAWCVDAHDDDSDEGIFRHQSRTLTVPGVILERRLSEGEGVRRLAIATQFEVAAYQYDQGPDLWVVVSDENQRLELTLESVRRLRAALDELVASVSAV